jgi:predicted O-methyltransferase YrrM
MKAPKPARYLLVVAAALRARRRIRALGDLPSDAAVEFARTFTWYGDKLRPTQSTEEITGLMELLRRDPPRTVVEIGMDYGGTLFLWTRVAAPDALLVAVDYRPLGRLGLRSPFAVVRKGLARAGQRVELVMPADSHRPETLARVRALVGERGIDLLFLDGDHSYEGVKRDFDDYSQLVRPGGLVVLHDVAGPGEPHVVRYWQELKQSQATEELVATTGERYGLGIVRIPG